MSVSPLVATPTVVTGTRYRIHASSAALRKHLTDAYWCPHMDEVCEGRLEGTAVRKTGDMLVMVKFESLKPSPKGICYPICLSIPIQYLVPVRRGTGTWGIGQSLPVARGAFGTTPCPDNTLANSVPSQGDHQPFKMCVVCGRYDLPGEMRKHGYKCNGCIGLKSNPRLRDETRRASEVTE